MSTVESVMASYNFFPDWMLNPSIVFERLADSTIYYDFFTLYAENIVDYMVAVILTGFLLGIGLSLVAITAIWMRSILTSSFIR